MTRTASIIWSVVEIIGVLFLMFFAVLLIIVGIGFATDAPHNLAGDLGTGIFCLLIAIAMTFIAIVLYKHSIRRLRLHRWPGQWSKLFLPASCCFARAWWPFWALQLQKAHRMRLLGTCGLESFVGLWHWP